MLGKCFFILIALSVAAAIPTGNFAALSGAIVDGASRAVTLTLSLAGMMALWGGVMRVLREAGMIRHLGRLLAPLLRLAFPHAYRTGEAWEDIVASVSANILGVGNAATPLALSAMEKMQKGNPTPARATDDMVTLAVLGCAPPALLPTTLIALRRAAGAAHPYEIVFPVWIVSFACAVLGVVLCRLFSLTGRGHRRD